MVRLFGINSWGPMIHRAWFFISEAFIGMKRSSLIMLISAMTIFISLVVFGFFLVLNFNLMSLSSYMDSKLEIRLFLKGGLTKKEIQQFQSSVGAFPEVKQVTFIHKDRSWSSFKSTYSNLSLETFVDKNPLPHSLKVELFDPAMTTRVSGLLKGFPLFVEEVVYGGVLSERLYQVSRFVLIFGWSLVGFLFLATFLIVVNTIKLTIVNRSEEITIMKLVGATDMFVMGPFLMEGFILGLVSSFLAIAVIHVGGQFLMHQLLAAMPFVPASVSMDQFVMIYAMVAICGTLLSFFGAMVSTKATLKQSL